ncbi:isochorismatase family protein [Shewanella intestini]|uniref:Isochorismatase family protein n=1 Tax=Shewanella intestini TaxID=2017544 RepID=A0ABS5I360_9GAMM|nr:MULTISPECIES: isochorismatase family protein [Shewanella]MBR9728473.1 isochorismatase family protein [Shewanella intestini]MRG36292.1 isochorismatase family protein [Shewanella sp. XMDDZSB0408]
MIPPQETVLMIVDVQGKLAEVMQQTGVLHQQLATLIQGAQLFEIPIIWLEQLPEKLGSTSPSLCQLLEKTTQPISKSHFSGWSCEQVQQQLQAYNPQHIILAGIESHVCVYQTCQDLLSQGYCVHVVADAVSSRSVDNKVLGIQMMINQGALLTNVESLLFEMQHIAQGDRFKALLKLIK